MSKKMNKSNLTKLNKKMGYITSVNEAKDVLEKLYKSNSN